MVIPTAMIDLPMDLSAVQWAAQENASLVFLSSYVSEDRVKLLLDCISICIVILTIKSTSQFVKLLLALKSTIRSNMNLKKHSLTIKSMKKEDS